MSMQTVDRPSLERGDRVIDVPCGTGAALIMLADHVGRSGCVVGFDYAERMLAIARRNVHGAGFQNVELHVGDMTAITPREPYDAVLCALGLFFVDDTSGFAHSLLRLMRPGGGRLAVTVFGEHMRARRAADH